MVSKVDGEGTVNGVLPLFVSSQTAIMVIYNCVSIQSLRTFYFKRLLA